MLSSIEQCFCMLSAHFSNRLYYSSPPWWWSTTFSKVEDVCQARLWRLLLLLQLLHFVLHHDALPEQGQHLNSIIIFDPSWWEPVYLVFEIKCLVLWVMYLVFWVMYLVFWTVYLPFWTVYLGDQLYLVFWQMYLGDVFGILENLVIFSPGRPIRKIQGSHCKKTTLTWWGGNINNVGLFVCSLIHSFATLMSPSLLWVSIDPPPLLL